MTLPHHKIAIVGEAWGEHYALVDEEDYENIVSFRWSLVKRGKFFHAMRKINRHDTIFMHRYILGLKRGDGTIVDHINGDGLDNRKNNLRLVSKRGNAINSDRSRNARLIERTGSRFRLRVSIDGVRITLGTFKTEHEALEAARNYKYAHGIL